MAPSVDAIPHSTRSGSALRTAAARISLVASASEPAIASSSTWIPADAPICSARLMASAASSGPTVRTTTSTPSPSSATRRACSTAYSSSSDSRPSVASRSTVWSAAKPRSPVASGTCFTSTRIFMPSPLCVSPFELVPAGPIPGREPILPVSNLGSVRAAVWCRAQCRPPVRREGSVARPDPDLVMLSDPAARDQHEISERYEPHSGDPATPGGLVLSRRPPARRRRPLRSVVAPRDAGGAGADRRGQGASATST